MKSSVAHLVAKRGQGRSRLNREWTTNLLMYDLAELRDLKMRTHKISLIGRIVRGSNRRFPRYTI